MQWEEDLPRATPSLIAKEAAGRPYAEQLSQKCKKLLGAKSRANTLDTLAEIKEAFEGLCGVYGVPPPAIPCAHRVPADGKDWRRALFCHADIVSGAFNRDEFLKSFAKHLGRVLDQYCCSVEELSLRQERVRR